MESNGGPLVSETTALPTEPQPLTNHCNNLIMNSLIIVISLFQVWHQSKSSHLSRALQVRCGGPDVVLRVVGVAIGGGSVAEVRLAVEVGSLAGLKLANRCKLI